MELFLTYLMKKLSDIRRISVKEYIDTSLAENKKIGTWLWREAKEHLLREGHKDADNCKSFLEFSVFMRDLALLTGHTNPYKLAHEYALIELKRKIIEDLVLFSKECGVLAYKANKERKRDKQINMFVGMDAAHEQIALELTDLLVDVNLPYSPKPVTMTDTYSLIDAYKVRE